VTSYSPTYLSKEDCVKAAESGQMHESRLISLLQARFGAIFTVESCTGGLLAHRLTDIPGSSEVFAGGLTVYSNPAKTVLAGVDARLIASEGAVSAEVAQALALGGLTQLRGIWKKGEFWMALATTGIAGPGGGSPQKPVGLCHIAIAWQQDEYEPRVLGFSVQTPADLNRSGNKRVFSEMTILQAIDLVEKMQ
jgi:PncC family amidohydrolase